MISCSCCGPFAVRLTATSTSSKCVCGRGIATVNDMSTGRFAPLSAAAGQSTTRRRTLLGVCAFRKASFEKLMTSAVECYYTLRPSAYLCVFIGLAERWPGLVSIFLVNGKHQGQ